MSTRGPSVAGTSTPSGPVVRSAPPGSEPRTCRPGSSGSEKPGRRRPPGDDEDVDRRGARARRRWCRRRRAPTAARRAGGRRGHGARCARSAYAARVVRSQSSGRCHGIVRRESSPLTPSSPISSPAKSIGTPGRVNCRPAATRCTAASPPTTVRIRAESWEPRMFQLDAVARQPSVPCQARSVSTTRRAVASGDRHRPAEGAGGRRRVAQPRPHRPREAGVVHRAVPAVAVDVAGRVVVVLADDPRVLAQLGGGGAHRSGDLVGDVDVGQPAGHVGDVDAPAVDVVRRPQPAPDHRVRSLDHRVPDVVVGVVDLGQRAVAHPARVGAVLLEVVEGAVRVVDAVDRGQEPLVGVAGVVGGEVAQDPPAAGVDRLAEPGVRLVAAEQRVDLGEGGRVVAVVALAGEDRRRVDDVGADLLDVVEVLGDAVEVAAVELHRRARVAALEAHLVVPLGRQRPVGDLALVGRRGAGEPVGEDLVDHRVASPVRRGREGREPEVVAVGDVVVDGAGAGQPLLRAVGPDEQEPVVRDRVVHRQRRLPPHDVAVGGGRSSGGRPARRRTSSAARSPPPGRRRWSGPARSPSRPGRAPRRRRRAGSRRGAAGGGGSRASSSTT